MIAVLRTPDTDDITAAAALLYRSILPSPTNRPLGSATIGCRAAFADLLTACPYLDRVDLAVSGERIDGVACWINHAQRLKPSPAEADRTALDDLLDRLHITDLIVAVSDGHSHQHLACLGTRPGHHARAVTDLLLHRQRLLKDRHGRTPLH